MQNYTFDVKLVATFTVPAVSEATARHMLRNLLDCASINAGALPSGAPLIGEGAQDGSADLVSVDACYGVQP